MGFQLPFPQLVSLPDFRDPSTVPRFLQVRIASTGAVLATGPFGVDQVTGFFSFAKTGGRNFHGEISQKYPESSGEMFHGEIPKNIPGGFSFWWWGWGSDFVFW